MESCGPTITPTYSKLCVGDNGGGAAWLNGQSRFADFDSKTRTVSHASMLERFFTFSRALGANLPSRRQWTSPELFMRAGDREASPPEET